MKRFRKIYLEITNVCNLHCSFCHGTGRKPAFMSIEDFHTFSIELRQYSDYIYFHLMGEPLLHPELDAFLKISSDLGFRVILTTNGTLLKKRILSLLSSEALDKVNISLHSFEANKEDNCLDSYLTDCILFAKQAQNCKVNFRLWNLNGLNSQNEEILSALHRAFPGNWVETRNGITLSDGIYLQYAEKFEWPDLSAPDYGSDGFCYGLRDQIGVLCDGTVVPCCLDSEGTISLGNLKDTTLREILDGERAKKFYSEFSNRIRSEELCRHCGFANRFQK